MDFAADNLQKALLTGLSTLCEDLVVLNFPFLGSYPLRFKKLLVPAINFEKKIHGYSGISKNYYNLTFYKKIHILKSAEKWITKWCQEHNGEKIVIVYSFAYCLLEAVINVKKNNNELKICLIVPDLPNYYVPLSNKYEYFVSRVINFRYSFEILSRGVDCYVLLSKYMSERLPVENKPWVVMEGIYNPELEVGNIERLKKGERWILYSGSLAHRYGVLDLTRAFLRLNNSDYRLIICGAGGAQAEICELATTDSRIVCKSKLSRVDLFNLQRMSDLLVNPCPPDQEFTKYFFPSKTMEYFASGTPTLLYKLPGIPEEYYNYCFTVDGLSGENLASKIDSVLSMKKETLTDLGMKAREFILTQKNPQKQCKKILDLINSL